MSQLDGLVPGGVLDRCVAPESTWSFLKPQDFRRKAVIRDESGAVQLGRFCGTAMGAAMGPAAMGLPASLCEASEWSQWTRNINRRIPRYFWLEKYSNLTAVVGDANILGYYTI